VVGAQGVLFRPERFRGRKHTLDLPSGYAGDINSWRGHNPTQDPRGEICSAGNPPGLGRGGHKEL
jgi:hypothetical protein